MPSCLNFKQKRLIACAVQQTRELISARKTSHKRNEDPSCANSKSPGMRAKTRYISTTGISSVHVSTLRRIAASHKQMHYGLDTSEGDNQRMYLRWSLRTLYLLACQVRVTVSDSGLCCRVCMRSFHHKHWPIYDWLFNVRVSFELRLAPLFANCCL